MNPHRHHPQSTLQAPQDGRTNRADRIPRVHVKKPVKRHRSAEEADVKVPESVKAFVKRMMQPPS
jgi:hypothetical protein